MKCNYKPPKLTKEEQQEMASMKSTLPYIDRLVIEKRKFCEREEYTISADQFIENMQSRMIRLGE